ncbi:DUF4127 family protein [Paraoerskovia marina]|uniref:DUF4127 family protein n=1 Tax=Paraoerskovia marina TaxID=545619 RepID=UPI0006950920|nr:DUF4127 family protein [Paraoerskovia marina]
MTRIALVPLDDRPVSRSLPGEIAAIAGIEVAVPPADATPSVREIPDAAAVARWYADVRPRTDASVLSLDALSFGSLIRSRIGSQTVREALEAWAPLERPGPPAYAAVVVPRTPDSDDAMEEPEYWSTAGPSLHRLSGALAEGVDDLDGARERVAPQVPRGVAADWAGRRLRQHALALAALDLRRRDLLTGLVIGVDDATGTSLSARAQADLDRWVDVVGLRDDVLVHPGADETGAVLVARCAVDALGAPAPRVAIDCAVPDGLERTAAYETGPVHLTARRQLEAAGARVVPDPDAADVVVVVHPPGDPAFRGDWAVAPPARLDHAAASATAGLVRRHLADGRRVALADVAQPNGADPALAAAIGTADDWARLDGYAAWNTAGNTLGTVAAQVVVTAAARAVGAFDARAHRRAITRRVVEDLGWMSVVRAQVRAELGSDPTRHDAVDLDDATRARWEGRLTAAVQACGGLDDVEIVPGSLHLPWGRTFEIDLTTRDRPDGDPA